MNVLQNKKFRHGSVSLALVIVIIAAVILLNAIFTALSEKFVWYLDMTAEEIYTLSDEAKELLDTVDSSRTVTIIFCTPKEDLEANATQRYALYTALEMNKAYPHIHIKYVDILTNPSAVRRYEESAGQNVTSSSVIVTADTMVTNPNTGEKELKTQSRVYTLNSLYTYGSTTSTTTSTSAEVVGYNGEQRLVSAILAVTQTETPLACYTIGHGESDSLMDVTAGGSPLLTLLYETGYEVKPVDLSKEEIPADCKLIVIYDPQSDFLEANAAGNVSELRKLDAFLASNRSVMTFFDHETPIEKMPNLDAFLKEWGMEIARYTDTTTGVSANYWVTDTGNTLDASGHSNVANYVEGGLGASITRQLRESNYPKRVIFQDATAIKCSYEWIDDNVNGYAFGSDYTDGITREYYDVFTSSSGAHAMAGEQKITEGAPYSYMAVTRRMVYDEEGNTSYSYLLACASTKFASTAALASGYGNHTVLTRACHELGGARVSVSLDCKYFTDNEINSITAKAANQYTVVLTVIPAAAIFIAGIIIMVRRKYA
ncbi:MAG: GldG family protein [Clostridia bacterium]|nr:GldG family protein [Clostridia bacterium]